MSREKIVTFQEEDQQSKLSEQANKNEEGQKSPRSHHSQDKDLNVEEKVDTKHSVKPDSEAQEATVKEKEKPADILSVAEIHEQLRQAEKRRAAYLKEKETLDKKMKAMKAAESARALYQLQQTKLVPDKDAQDHMWTDEEISAQKAIDLVERAKYKAKGQPRTLTYNEKQRLLVNDAKSLGEVLEANTFYEAHPEWFAFETRTRDMILAIVEPIIKKTLQDQNYVQKVVQNQDYQKTKLDEHELVFQKILKRQSKQDDFEERAREGEHKMKARDQDFDKKYKEVEAIKAQVNQRYHQMKQERDDNVKKMELMEGEIQKYRDQFSLNLIEMEAQLIKMDHKLASKVEHLAGALEANIKQMNHLNTLTANIRQQFVTFGEGITLSKYRLDLLEPMCLQMKEAKAEKLETTERMELSEKNIRDAFQEIQSLSFDCQNTEKYIKLYLPINFVTEIDRAFRAVFPRRRHQMLLQDFTTKRQLDLKRLCGTQKYERLDKTAYVLADSHLVNRQQSIDSDYIREGVAMYRQSLNKSGGAAASKGGHHKHRPSHKHSKKTLKHGATVNLDAGAGDLSMRDGSQSSVIKGSASRKVDRTKTKKRRGTVVAKNLTQGINLNNLRNFQEVSAKRDLEEDVPPKSSCRQSSECPGDNQVSTSQRKKQANNFCADELNEDNARDDSSCCSGAQIKTPDESQTQKQQMKQQIEDNTLVNQLLEKVQNLEMNQMILKTEFEKEEKIRENEEFLGLKNDQESERLSTIQDDEESEDKQNPHLKKKSMLKNIETTVVDKKGGTKKRPKSKNKKKKNQEKSIDNANEPAFFKELEQKADKRGQISLKKGKSRSKDRTNENSKGASTSLFDEPIAAAVFVGKEDNLHSRNSKLANFGGSGSAQIIDIQIGVEGSINAEQRLITEGYLQQKQYESDSDLGEDYGEGESMEPKGIQFVEKEEMEAVKKQIEEQHRINDTFRSMLTDVSGELNTFRTQISPDDQFSYKKYMEDLDSQSTKASDMQTRVADDFKRVYAILSEHEQTEHRDRVLLYTEIQNTNRRIYTSKKEVRDDFESFSKTLREIDEKSLQYLRSGVNLIELAGVMSQLVKNQSCLMKGDEQDKKGIFLLGVKEEHRDQRLTKGQLHQKQMERLDDFYGDSKDLSLGQQHYERLRKENESIYLGEPPKAIVDRNLKCFSCSDQPAKLLTAFKMACLSYKPGKVIYEGHEISRDALITVNDSILNKLEENQREATGLVQNLSLQMAMEAKQKASQHGQISEKQKVLFYDASLSQTDMDILQLLESKKDFFSRPVGQQEPLSHQRPAQEKRGIVSIDLVAQSSAVLCISQSKDDLSKEAQKLKKQSQKRKTVQGFERNASGLDLQGVIGSEQTDGESNTERKSEHGLVGSQGATLPLRNQIGTNERASMQSSVQQMETLVEEPQVMMGIGMRQDRFNPKEGNPLINLEIRDQADQKYIDQKTRDINGNIKSPIGLDIDDMTTRHLYVQDPVHEQQLEKLAIIQHRSQVLGSVKQSESQGALILPLITTPPVHSNQGKNDSDSLNLLSNQSYQGQFDRDMQRQRRMQKFNEIEQQTRESMTPSGAGTRTSCFVRGTKDYMSPTGMSSGSLRQFGATNRSVLCFSPLSQSNIKKVEKQDEVAYNQEIHKMRIQEMYEKGGNNFYNKAFQEGLKMLHNRPNNQHLKRTLANKSVGVQNTSMREVNSASRRCVAGEIPSYKERRSSSRVLVDPNSVKALAQIVSRQQQQSVQGQLTALASPSKSKSVYDATFRQPNTQKAVSSNASVFKFEEYFAQRNHPHYEQFGGRQHSALIQMDEPAQSSTSLQTDQQPEPASKSYELVNARPLLETPLMKVQINVGSQDQSQCDLDRMIASTQNLQASEGSLAIENKDLKEFGLTQSSPPINGKFKQGMKLKDNYQHTSNS